MPNHDSYWYCGKPASAVVGISGIASARFGDVTANELSVGGCIEGTLLAKGHLHVLATGKVQGEARYATLEVDRGGVMDGRASHVEESARKAPDTSRVEIIENAAAE